MLGVSKHLEVCNFTFIILFRKAAKHLFCSCTERIYQTVAITKKTVDFVEKGVKLRLNIVDTPGFGDAIDDKNR